jgi:uncharacterized protein (DUF58 family)
MRAPTVTKKRSVRMRPTGWGFIIILVPILLAAWNTGANLLYIVVGGLISFVVLSAAFAAWALRDVEIQRNAPKAAYRHRPFPVHLRIENHRRWLAILSVRIERTGTTGTPLGYVLKIPAGHAARLAVEESMPNRGLFPLQPYRLITGFPFGLFETSISFHDDSEVLVYPRVFPVRANALDRIPTASQASAQASDDGDEFFALREYVVGDDIRRIVWRISARMGKWIVRELARYNSRMVILAIDTTYDPAVANFNESFEEAVETAASVAILLLRRRYEVSIITPDDFLPGGEGKGHERRVLRMLAQVNPTEGTATFSQKLATFETMESTIFHISPDPAKWGSPQGHGRILDPRELVYG